MRNGKEWTQWSRIAADGESISLFYLLYDWHRNYVIANYLVTIMFARRSIMFMEENSKGNTFFAYYNITIKYRKYICIEYNNIIYNI